METYAIIGIGVGAVLLTWVLYRKYSGEGMSWMRAFGMSDE